MFLIGTEYPTAAYSRKIAERKAEHGGAAAYLYRFDWETPIAGGRLKSPHALEIPFVFDNTALAPRLAPDRPDVHALAHAMAIDGLRSRAVAIRTLTKRLDGRPTTRRIARR